MSNLFTHQNKGNEQNSVIIIPSLSKDRRQDNYDQNVLWEKLNLSQQYAVCSLGQFGYILTYVRYFNEATLAILKTENKTATINEAGDINISPNVQCREA